MLVVGMDAFASLGAMRSPEMEHRALLHFAFQLGIILWVLDLYYGQPKSRLTALQYHLIWCLYEGRKLEKIPSLVVQYDTIPKL